MVVSDNPSLLTSIVIGKSDLAKDSPLNDKEPLCCPEPDTSTTPPKDGVDIPPPPAFVIVISPVVIVADKFC